MAAAREDTREVAGADRQRTEDEIARLLPRRDRLQPPVGRRTARGAHVVLHARQPPRERRIRLHAAHAQIAQRLGTVDLHHAFRFCFCFCCSFCRSAEAAATSAAVFEIAVASADPSPTTVTRIVTIGSCADPFTSTSS